MAVKRIKLKLRRVGKEWYVVLPDCECGPYDSHGDAVEARDGLERFYNVEMKRRN